MLGARPRITGSGIGGGGLASLRDGLSGGDGGASDTGDRPGTRRPFLRRGEGRLGMTTLPAATSRDASRISTEGSFSSRKTKPVRRSLSLVRPASAASPSSDGGSIEEETPRSQAAAPAATSYTKLLQQKELLRKTSSVGMRPATAPRRSKSPDEPEPRDVQNLVHASSLSTAEGKRLQNMMKPVLLSTGRGGSGISASPNRSPNRSPTSSVQGPLVDGGRKQGKSSVSDDPKWDDVSEAIMRRARGEKPATSRAQADGGEGRREADAGAINSSKLDPGATAPGQRSPSAVDFSPVLQAVQGKLAALTQENIGLKETVATLQQQLSEVDQQYELRLRAAESKLHLEKEDEVRRVSQALRIRERQQEAWGKKSEMHKRNKEIDALKKELRACKQDVHIRESVLTQTIDKLKRDKARTDAANAELEQRVKQLEEANRAGEMNGGGLRTEVNSWIYIVYWNSWADSQPHITDYRLMWSVCSMWCEVE